MESSTSPGPSIAGPPSLTPEQPLSPLTGALVSEEAGLGLILGSVVLAIVGFVTLFILIGFFLLLIALVLFITGIVLLVSGHPRPADGVYFPPPPPFPGPYSSAYALPPALQAQTSHVTGPFAQPSPAERFCPACGSGNLRISAYCHRCGKVLPPP